MNTLKNTSVFLLALCLCSFITKISNEKVFKTINPSTFNTLLEGDSNAIIIDVRTHNEFKALHIPNAININYNADNFNEEIAKLDPSKSYFLYCTCSRRSSSALKTFKKLEFNTVYNLKGGFINWYKNQNRN